MKAASEKLMTLETDALECTRAISERARAWREVNQAQKEEHHLTWKLSDAQLQAWGHERKLVAAKAQVQRAQATRERREEHKRRQAVEITALDESRRHAEHRCELLREELGVADGEARTLQAWLRHSATDAEKNFGGVAIPQWVLPSRSTTMAKDATL